MVGEFLESQQGGGLVVRMRVWALETRGLDPLVQGSQFWHPECAKQRRLINIKRLVDLIFFLKTLAVQK